MERTIYSIPEEYRSQRNESHRQHQTHRQQKSTQNRYQRKVGLFHHQR